MSSGGKSKKPPRNPGAAANDPTILNPGEAPNPPIYGAYVTDFGVRQLTTVDFDMTPMMRTYHLVEAVLQERLRSLPVALAMNTARHGIRDRWADWLTSAGAGAAAGAAIDPVLGIGVALAGVFARNIVEVLRLRRGRHKEVAPGKSKAGAEIRIAVQDLLGELPTRIDLRGKLPDLPEFNNEWVRLAYRLVRLSMGYNVRVDVVNRIRLALTRGQMAEKTAVVLASAADGMDQMLIMVRPRIEEVARVLEELQPRDFKELRKLDEHDDRLQTDDLLGEDRGEAAVLLWLDVPYEKIGLREAPRVHETDRAVVEGRIELDEELSLERRFEKLEQELILEKERLEGELEKLMKSIEGLPSEEQPAAQEKLEKIRQRLRDLADLDETLEIESSDAVETPQ